MSIRIAQCAKTWRSSANALNSRALPDGSSRNIVDCSPTSPAKRVCGSMTNSTPAATQPVGERVPVRRVEEDAEVGNRHGVAVDLVAEQVAPVGIGQTRVEVGDELVAVEVEVDPRRRRPTLRATEHVAVERRGGGEVVDRHRQMEARPSGSPPSGVALAVMFTAAGRRCPGRSRSACRCGRRTTRGRCRRRCADRPTRALPGPQHRALGRTEEADRQLRRERHRLHPADGTEHQIPQGGVGEPELARPRDEAPGSEFGLVDVAARHGERRARRPRTSCSSPGTARRPSD